MFEQFVIMLYQKEATNSTWKILQKYINLLLDGSDVGKIYLVSCLFLVVSYYLFRTYRHYLTTLISIYILLFIFYFISIHYYYQGIESWVKIGHGNPQQYDEMYFSNLDTSIFFMLYNFIFVMILFFHKKKLKEIK